MINHYNKGDLVVFTGKSLREMYPCLYPKVGTKGSIVRYDNFLHEYLVKWEDTTLISGGQWFTPTNCLMRYEEETPPAKVEISYEIPFIVQKTPKPLRKIYNKLKEGLVDKKYDK